MPKTKRHKVFISFHDDDKEYKDEFVRRMGDGIVNKSVDDDDIDDTNIRLGESGLGNQLWLATEPEQTQMRFIGHLK